MKAIAFFDFDGTITKKDTLLEFIKFSKGRLSFYIGFTLHLPVLVAMKLGWLSNQTAKEKVLAYFFRGSDLETFDQLCKNFSEKVLPKLIRPNALEEIEQLRSQGFTIVIVSASPENWIRYWAAEQNVEFLGSCLHVKEGKLTGRLNGRNCHGHEKVRKIKEKYDLSEYGIIHAYGDTKGDFPMLAIASEKRYKPFR